MSSSAKNLLLGTRFVRQVAAGIIGIGGRERGARSILSLPRFPLSSPRLASRYLISPTAEEMKSRPGRDSRDVCPVIRSALLRASSRECSAAVEYVFRAFESADTSIPPRPPPADTSYANRIRASSNQRKSNVSAGATLWFTKYLVTRGIGIILN